MSARHDPTTSTAAFRTLGRENGRNGAVRKVPAGAETAVLACENAKETRADRDPARRLAEVTRRFEAVRLAWAATRAAAARAERRAEAVRTERRACAAGAVAARVEARRLRREAAKLFAALSALAVEAAAAAEAAARRKAH